MRVIPARLRQADLNRTGQRTLFAQPGRLCGRLRRYRRVCDLVCLDHCQCPVGVGMAVGNGMSRAKTYSHEPSLRRGANGMTRQKVQP